MSPGIIRALALVISSGAIFSAPARVSSDARPQGDEPARSWQRELYEEGVKYEDSACREEDAQAVATFFAERPLKDWLPVCHNDCPIVKCRPVVPLPSVAKSARAAGTISVHVLVDEGGKVLYARVLRGHPLLRAAARRGACETQFDPYPYHRRQGVMHFTVDGYDFLGVPNRANEVR